MIRELSCKEMDSLLEKAAESERKRTHLLWHAGPEDPVHRMCIAAMPETVFKKHRHPGKWELMILLRGEGIMHFFTANGSEVRQIAVSAPRVLELPDDLFHQFQVLQPVVFFEVKAGPLSTPEELD